MVSSVSPKTKSKSKKRGKGKSKEAALAAEATTTFGTLESPPSTANTASTAVQIWERKEQARKAAKIEYLLGNDAAAKNNFKTAIECWTRAQAGGDISASHSLIEHEKPAQRVLPPHKPWQSLTWPR
jgi:hypothetical protein